MKPSAGLAFREMFVPPNYPMRKEHKFCVCPVADRRVCPRHRTATHGTSIGEVLFGSAVTGSTSIGAQYAEDCMRHASRGHLNTARSPIASLADPIRLDAAPRWCRLSRDLIIPPETAACNLQGQTRAQ